jgi:peptidyl-prolyl cis-trans isomerase SurA
LPYEFENAIYATKPGEVSALVRSRNGLHIFKNLGERKAKGKIKAQQILLAIPPGTDEAAKKQIAAKADSLYKRLLAGDNFDKLAFAFSNDYVSAGNGGKLPDIGVGQYSPEFENILWSLPKDGAISKPVLTSHGYHIVKRVSLIPVITDPNNKTNQIDLAQKVSMDSRWRSSREFIYEKVANQAGFKKAAYSEAALWALSDSLLDNKPAGAGRSMNTASVLFTVGDTTIRVSNWISYAQSYRFKSDGSGLKTYDQLMEEFVKSSFYNYYRDHLENYNEDFRWQMSEFKEGNLFFEIMQREVWNHGHSDTAALMEMFEKNRSKYIWNKSADAVIFFCNDSATANRVYALVKKDPKNWRAIITPVSEMVAADSSRYEWEQIPNLNKAVPKAGMVTEPVVSATDNTASFAYIVRVYPEPAPRNFNDAKGLIINDYQTQLEKEWVKRLREKYPVKIDEKVFASISK